MCVCVGGGPYKWNKYACFKINDKYLKIIIESWFIFRKDT